MKKRETMLRVIAGIIAALFFYAAISKLIDFDRSRQEMRNQVFPKAIADLLLWMVPITEMVLVFPLLYLNTRLKAMYASVALLVIFTIYISVSMTGIFGRVPCSCGGILKHMSYSTHIIFNLLFIVLGLWGIAIEKEWKAINRWFNNQKRKELRAIE